MLCGGWKRMFLPATVAVGIIQCGINDIQEHSAHSYEPHIIAKNVILCGSKLKQRSALISVIIVGILPAAEAFRGRNSMIDQVNSLLREACSINGFLYVEPGSCWRDLDSGEINQSLYWRDGLHLNKRGCDMLASIYAKAINQTNQTISNVIKDQPSKINSLPPMIHHHPLISDDCNYTHSAPDDDDSFIPVATHQCHHHKKKKKSIYKQKPPVRTAPPSPTSFSSSPPLPKPPPPPLMSPTRKYKKIGRRKKKYKVTNFREHCRFSFFFFLVFSLFELSGNGEYFVHFFTSSLAIDDSLPDCLCVSNLVSLSPLVTFMMFISFQFLYVLFIHTLQRIKMYCAGSILIIIRRRSMSTLFYFFVFYMASILPGTLL